MKYMAIVDDELLANFRVDIKSNGQSCSDIVFVVTDKAGSTRGIGLKPLQKEMLVTKDGNSVYLQQKHIDCLIEMERKEMFDKMVQDIIKNFGLTEFGLTEEDINDRAKTTDKTDR